MVRDVEESVIVAATDVMCLSDVQLRRQVLYYIHKISKLAFTEIFTVILAVFILYTELLTTVISFPI